MSKQRKEKNEKGNLRPTEVHHSTTTHTMVVMVTSALRSAGRGRGCGVHLDLRGRNPAAAAACAAVTAACGVLRSVHAAHPRSFSSQRDKVTVSQALWEGKGRQWTVLVATCTWWLGQSWSLGISLKQQNTNNTAPENAYTLKEWCPQKVFSYYQ